MSVSCVFSSILPTLLLSFRNSSIRFFSLFATRVIRGRLLAVANSVFCSAAIFSQQLRYGRGRCSVRAVGFLPFLSHLYHLLSLASFFAFSNFLFQSPFSLFLCPRPSLSLGAFPPFSFFPFWRAQK